MVWLRLFGVFKNVILFFGSPFCSGVGGTPSVRAQRVWCRAGSRGLCPVPAQSGSEGSAAPLETWGRWRHPRECSRGGQRLPGVRASSVRPRNPSSWLPGRQVPLPEPWRDRKYLLLARVNAARKLIGCAAFSFMKAAANSHQFLEAKILLQPSF